VVGATVVQYAVKNKYHMNPPASRDLEEAACTATASTAIISRIACIANCLP